MGIFFANINENDPDDQSSLNFEFLPRLTYTRAGGHSLSLCWIVWAIIISWGGEPL